MELKQRYDHTYKVLDRESQLIIDSICKSFSVGVDPDLAESKSDSDSDLESNRTDEITDNSSDSLTVIPSKESFSDPHENNSCHIRESTTIADVVANFENVDIPYEVTKLEKVDKAGELTNPIQVGISEIAVKPIAVSKPNKSDKEGTANHSLKVVDHENSDNAHKANTSCKFVKSDKADDPHKPFDKAELPSPTKAKNPFTDLDRHASITDTSNESYQLTSRLKLVPNDIKDLTSVTDVPEGSTLSQIIVKSGMVEEKIYIGPNGDKLIFKRIDD